MEQAEAGIKELAKNVDSLIVIPNERLKLLSGEKITLANAFDAADDILRQGVKSISELVANAGYINLDFADVSSIMRDAGQAHMGVGRASGKDKAEAAANLAITSPLLETTIDGAHGVIISITASPDVGLDEVTQASELISGAAHPDANIIWGVSFDTSLQDEIIVTVVATGFGPEGFKHAKAVKEVAEDSDSREDITNIMASDDDIMGFGEDSGSSSAGGFGMDDGYFDALDDIFSSRS